jgi:hypothetical protein
MCHVVLICQGNHALPRLRVLRVFVVSMAVPLAATTNSARAPAGDAATFVLDTRGNVYAGGFGDSACFLLDTTFFDTNATFILDTRVVQTLFSLWLTAHGRPADDPPDYVVPGGNGRTLWQNFIADLDPANHASDFRIAAASNQPPEQPAHRAVASSCSWTRIASRRDSTASAWSCRPDANDHHSPSPTLCRRVLPPAAPFFFAPCALSYTSQSLSVAKWRRVELAE